MLAEDDSASDAEQDLGNGAKLHLSRRHLLAALASLGIGSTSFSRALAVEAERGPIDAESVARAAWISGVELSSEQQASLVHRVERLQAKVRALRNVSLDADIPPSQHFQTWQDAYLRHEDYRIDTAGREESVPAIPPGELPTDDVGIAFASLRMLGAMIRQREISSVELTELYLDRLQRYGPQLNCVVTLTPELALKQARDADRALAAGRDLGPLHGIPWGAKDLIAVEGYPTTWGCEIYQQQVLPGNATVAQRLEAAGAVLVAKLSLGAIAMGDEWFGGQTLNPWDLNEGSSGSSAGSAAATVAGLVAFSLGSETLGSIVSPSRRCGATGLRPTFGRVSRAGCMPLAWSFDKLGPICRSVEDTALVFSAIHGADGRDPTAVTHPFPWPDKTNLSNLCVGHRGPDDDREELQLLRQLGVKLKRIELPDELPLDALTLMLDVESASMFYDDWHSGREEGLFRWPRIWQAAAYVSAIDYVRASRVRSLLMKRMEQVMSEVDLYVNGDDLVLTNLTGHPSVVLPYFASESETVKPGSLTFSGRLHDESRLLALAKAFQESKQDHLKRPPLFAGR